MRSSWHVEEAAKEGTAGVELRTVDTSPGQPGRSISGFPARSFCAPSGPTRKPSWCRSCALEVRQIGVQSATINMQLDGQIGSQKEGLQGDEGGWT